MSGGGVLLLVIIHERLIISICESSVGWRFLSTFTAVQDTQRTFEGGGGGGGGEVEGVVGYWDLIKRYSEREMENNVLKIENMVALFIFAKISILSYFTNTIQMISILLKRTSS